jgi:hypothetical protein
LTFKASLKGASLVFRRKSRQFTFYLAAYMGRSLPKVDLRPALNLQLPECFDAAVVMWYLNLSVLRVCKDDCVPFLEATGPARQGHHLFMPKVQQSFEIQAGYLLANQKRDSGNLFEMRTPMGRSMDRSDFALRDRS